MEIPPCNFAQDLATGCGGFMSTIIVEAGNDLQESLTGMAAQMYKSNLQTKPQEGALDSAKARCTALLIVDAQNDFIDGSMAVRNCPAHQEGSEIIPIINQLRSLPLWKHVAWSLDSHPKDHCSFVTNVSKHPFHETSPIEPNQAKLYDTVILQGPNNKPMEQQLWPEHCVDGSWGAKLHKDLVVQKDDIFIKKGTNSNVDSYSAFFDNAKVAKTDLESTLKRHGITDLYMCGIATDYCVGFTALHGRELGYNVSLIWDACRGVNNENIEKMKKKMLEAGVRITDTTSVKKESAEKVIECTPPRLPISWDTSSTSLGQESKEGDPMSALPNELLEKIFECLTATGLARFERACQSWKQKAGDVEAWQILVKRDFPWAHRVLASLHQTRLNQTHGSIVWSQVYQAYSLGQVPWRKEHRLEIHARMTTCITALPDGRFATGSRGWEACIWSPEGEKLHKLHGHTDMISCITALSDGRLATGSDDCTARIWSPKGEELHVLSGHWDSIVCIIALSDGRIITASRDRTACIWSPEGKELHVLSGHTDKIKCITALSDGRLATGSDDCTARIWSPKGEKLHELRGHTKWISCITALSDGRLATGSWDHTARIWSPKGEELHILRGHTKWICCIIALSDGRLVTSSADCTARIWSLEGKELHVLRGHTGRIECIMALSNGCLVTGSSDRTVRIWSPEGEELHVLQHTESIYRLTALTDGRLAGSGDNTVGIWSPDLNALFEASLKVDEGDPLFQSPNLALPECKAQSDIEHGEVLIDAAEIPIESPKKGKSGSALGKRKDRSYYLRWW